MGPLLTTKVTKAHIRNIYHHLSPSILWELKAQSVPVLYHLNDFKLLCPAYNLVSQGEACEACKGGAFRHMVRSDCYPGLAERSVLASEAYLHRILGSYSKCVDLFLAPSQFVRDKFVEHGWERTRFEVLPHFQRVQSDPKPVPKNAPVLYVGRLSAEKGVADLLRAMQKVPHLRLKIAGDGPERSALERLAASLDLGNVEFMGKVSAEERDRLLSESKFTILPSHAYETLGKTILESYALARAVVASDAGSRREFVQDGQTGLLYRCGDVDALAGAIQWMAKNPETADLMGRNGLELVRRHHGPEPHYQRMIGLYERLIATKGRRFENISIGPKEERNSRPRIAFIGGRGVISKYSGIESYYEEVGKHLARRGNEITVYCRKHFTPALAEHNGMRLVRLPTIRSKHLETVIHTFLSTAHAITQGYDVVHYHALGPALFSWIPRVFGMKTAVTVQGLDWQRKKWGMLASAVLSGGEKASARFPNATMVVSKELQQRYTQTHGIESFYVPNGGILRDRRPAKKILEWGLDAGQYVLFLGRFSPEKGCHLLVRAFEQIETDVKLVMAGAASYCDEYSRELLRHASDKIRILDWVSGETLDELLTNAMIFVLPSDMEGLSLALLDAMGASLCVLASDIPENREVVEGAGYLFKPGDADDLAERLRFLISNPSVREAAGRTARGRIEDEYQWPEIATQIEKVYFHILGRDWAESLPMKPSARAAAVGAAQRRAS
jgi:glycosyltransferase involved in cell wall biosynthesis